MSLKETNDDSDSKASSSYMCSEKAHLEELEKPNSLEELKLVLMKINKEKPCAIFKGKYQISILNSLFGWHNPFGGLLKKALVICGYKSRNFSETKSSHEEIIFEDSGLPLTVQFDPLLHLNEGESLHSSKKHLKTNQDLFPLSENIGRKILSMCNYIEMECIENLPILVVCYGINTKGASFFGSWRKNNNSRFHLTNQGSISKQEQLPRLAELKARHRKGFPPSTSNVEISVFARYDFIEYEHEENTVLKPVKDVNLCVECSWSNSSSILEPLTDECSCVVKLKAISGDSDSGAFSLFKQLELVQALHQSLKNGLMTWSTPERNKNVLQEVEIFINNEKLDRMKSSKPPVSVTEWKDVNFGALLEQTLIKERRDLDFTEKLWNILKDCCSTEELTGAFSVLYDKLGEFFSRPFVHHKNTSTLARTIKTMMEKKIVCPNLESQSIVKLLLEIGVEKLRRDYVTFFLSLGLVPIEYLSYYLQPEILSLEAMAGLRKLHSVVELLIVCVKYLNFSKPLLSSFVRNTLKHYTTVPDIDIEHVFDFQIPTVKARQLLDPMRPTVWELSLISSLNGFMKQSIHRYQTTPVHDHIFAPKNYNPNLLLKTASYTYLTCVFVQDC